MYIIFTFPEKNKDSLYIVNIYPKNTFKKISRSNNPSLRA